MQTVTLFALILFAVTYIVMMAFQKIRPHAAVISALIFVIVGSLNLFPGFSYSPLEALKEIDWNVIMMIVGTMGTVYLFIESKMPQLMADVLVDKTPSVKWAVLSLSLFAGFISGKGSDGQTLLDPQGNGTRAEVALALYNSYLRRKDGKVPLLLERYIKTAPGEPLELDSFFDSENFVPQELIALLK